MPMELVFSTGTPRWSAQAFWCALAWASLNGAIANGGASAAFCDDRAEVDSLLGIALSQMSSHVARNTACSGLPCDFLDYV